MEIKIPIVNAFVDENKGGNPAGVVVDAHTFNLTQKQQIAAAVGLSETAFVSPSTVADFKLEFFTPSRQIAHCGHATIATFSYLRQVGRLPNDQTSKETIDGRREIVMEGDFAYMEQLAPRYTALNEEYQLKVFDSLGIKPSSLLDKTQPWCVNTGNSFIIIALQDANATRLVKPNMTLISEISDEFDLIGYYLFSPQVENKGRNAAARMFAPRYGIDEESATGMAAGPLACYLHDKFQDKKDHYIIEQGHFMTPPSPSVIDVRLIIENGAISGLMAGGRASVREIKTIII